MQEKVVNIGHKSASNRHLFSTLHLFCTLIRFTFASNTAFGYTEKSGHHTLQLQQHENLEDKFILHFLQQEKFSMCSILAVQDRFNNGPSVDKLLHSVASITSSPNGEKSAYSIKYDVGSQKTTNKLAESKPVRFPRTVSNHRRTSDPCLVVILMMNDIRQEFVTQIYSMLTPVFLPITRKDEDFYIFKTRSSLHERLLLMNELPGRIKFKIAVGVENNVVKVRTVCFFCSPGGTPKVTEIPVTQYNTPIQDINYFPDFVWNLNGKVLHVSFPYVRSKIEADPPWQGVSNSRRGNWKMLFEEFLTVKFNFTYHMFAATGKDGNFGGGGTGLQLQNGTWIGVTGDLVSQKADLGIVIAQTPNRLQYIDFTNSFYDMGYLIFATGQPSRIYSPAALLWPFDWTMWVCIAFSIIFFILFFFQMLRLMNVYYCDAGEVTWSLNRQALFLISTFLEQDIPHLPKSQVLRCFISTWIFFTMIITTVYRSKMVTFLAFPVLSKVPKTFEELAFSDYQVGFLKHGDSAYNTLAASTDPVYKKLLGEMEIFKGFGLECLQKVVKEEHYACIGYNFAMTHLRERNFSSAETKKLVFAPASTYNVWLGLATEGKSIFRLNFGKMLGYTRPFHLAEIWDKMDMYYNVRLPKLQWWRRTNQMEKMKHVEVESENLTMKHIVGAFYVLIACLIAACGVFLHEYFLACSTRLYYRLVLNVRILVLIL